MTERICHIRICHICQASCGAVRSLPETAAEDLEHQLAGCGIYQIRSSYSDNNTQNAQGRGTDDKVDLKKSLQIFECMNCNEWLSASCSRPTS